MSLTTHELSQFERDGFLIKHGLFQDADLAPVRRAITEIIELELAEPETASLITDSHPELPFQRRLAAIYADSPEAGQRIMQRIGGKGGGGYNGPALLNCLRHPPLLDCIESIVGPDIIGSSVYRIRPKLPGLERGEVPWHQDSGYLLAHCDQHTIVTCWVPLVDATVDNGCMFAIAGAHRSGIMPHFTGGHGGFLEIPEDELPKSELIPLEVNVGGVVFLHNLTPHASFTNRTSNIRWSLDLRFQGAAVPNNVGIDPKFVPEQEPVTMACYPTEADFVLRDHRHPEREIRTADQFREVREKFERVVVDTPGRGWRPLTERRSRHAPPA